MNRELHLVLRKYLSYNKKITERARRLREMGKSMISIEELLQTAMQQNVSDVHISVGNVPQMRVNGRVVRLEGERISEEDMEHMVQSILNNKQRMCFEETGEVEVAFSTLQAGRCRVNVFSQSGYSAAVFRLLGSGIPKIEEVPIPQTVLELYREKRGLILISGASGSGRTTTAAVLIDRINGEIGGHILTLESPVEYLHTHKKAMVNQREIGTDTKDYGRALKAALRADADVIMVGSVRDAETIEAMITAAEMGHLVIGVMDAVGAVETIERTIEVFSPEQRKRMLNRLSSVLNAVVSQQLVPTLEGGKRQGVFDVMRVNRMVKNLICEGKLSQIADVMGTENGMQRMDTGVFELYIQGLIDRRQALDCVRDSSVLQKKLL